MRQNTLPRLLLFPLLAGLAMLTGCGDRTVAVSGTVVLPSGMKLNDSDSVSMQFVPDGAAGKPAVAAFSVSDHTFTAKNVVVGKYKITVKIEPYMGKEDAKKRSEAFAAINKSNAIGTTKLAYEVTAEPAQQSITIDVAKGTVTKK